MSQRILEVIRESRNKLGPKDQDVGVIEGQAGKTCAFPKAAINKVLKTLVLK
jgi:hypothetical protein